MKIAFSSMVHATLVLLLTFSAASAEATSVSPPSAEVRPGSDQILKHPYRTYLEGKRIGVLAHYASRLSSGKHVVDELAQSFDLRMIFSPEHGFRQLDDTSVPDSVDSITGLPVYSLYGPRKAPTSAMLSQIDVVLIDLQDVGLRYYTYPATVSYTLRAAKAAGKPVILLDRPNPLGALRVDGARMEAEIATGDLTTIARIPTQHGMTLGEIALYLNQDLDIHADLRIVPVENWSRELIWEETGLKWFPSSPALPHPDQVHLYSVLGTLESVALSVGRGIDNELAFRAYGAPWLDPEDARDLVNSLQSIPGMRFSPFEWTPDRSIYKGQLCRGFKAEITDLTKIKPLRVLIEVLKTLHRIGPEHIDLSRATRMLGTRWLPDGIRNQLPTDELIARSKAGYPEFLETRERVLLYRK